MGSSTVRRRRFGSDHGLIHEAVVTGRRVGAGADFWAALAHDETLFRRVVQMVLGDDSGFAEAGQAAAIMGTNFHGPDIASQYLGAKFSPVQKRKLLAVPFSIETLMACRDTYVLVAAASMSIMDVQAKSLDAFYSKSDPWYSSPAQEFAQAKIKPGWYLVRKQCVPYSTNNTWTSQLANLAPDEFVPETNVAVFAAILHYLQTGERMFSHNLWVRTDSVSSSGYHVSIGFHLDGLLLDDGSDSAGVGVGVASAQESG